MKVTQEDFTLPSESLKRDVKITVLKPHNIPSSNLPVLLINDGQDFPAIKLKNTYEQLLEKMLIKPITIVGIHAGDRIQEYGTSYTLDFAGRGKLATAYQKWLIEHLLTALGSKLGWAQLPNESGVAGFSMGALSAFDFSAQHADLFKYVGCFSGSFWWRSKKVGAGENGDAFRIVHKWVRDQKNWPNHLKYWFQAADQDETSDRNNNGIIDSIDDTLDLINELNKKGLRAWHSVYYQQIKEGKHDMKTWGQAMKPFLIWAYGTDQAVKESTLVRNF